MNPRDEERIFGYVDIVPPEPGTWKAEAFRLVAEAERTGNPFIKERTIQELSLYVDNMIELQRQRLKQYFSLIAKKQYVSLIAKVT